MSRPSPLPNPPQRSPPTTYLTSAKKNSAFKYNECDLYQLKPGVLSHTPGKYCIACRNYDLIDATAIRYALVWLKTQLVETEKLHPKLTVEELLKAILKHGLEYRYAHSVVEEKLKTIRNVDLALRVEQRKISANHQDISHQHKEKATRFKNFAEFMSALGEAADMLTGQLNTDKKMLNILEKRLNQSQEKLDHSASRRSGIQLLLNEQLLLRNDAKEALIRGDSTRAAFAGDIARRLISLPGLHTRLCTTEQSPIWRKRIPARCEIVASAMSNARETCYGLSKLFEAMFNATSTTSINPSSASEKARDLNSVAKFCGGEGRQGHEPQTGKADHDWNQFSLPGLPEPQLIDITWGMGQIDEQDRFHPLFNLSWFTRKLEGFRRTHFEYDLFETDLKKNVAHRPYVQPPITATDWYRSYIDYNSIQPANYNLQGIVKTDFKLAVRCPHYSWPFPAFAIVIPGNQNTAEVTVPFVNRGPALAPNWVAEVDLPKHRAAFDAKLKSDGSAEVLLVCFYESNDNLANGNPLTAGRTLDGSEHVTDKVAEWKLRLAR
ncbi:hypothetical protein GGR57DRAFT_505216 [Xylariaceae sp. FL1272]|nr:hypothetical protein GGR57DRAFT_505216 [Xylariaceae sp. FL1272]